MALAPAEVVVQIKDGSDYDILEERPAICDSFWACLLNDYLDAEDDVILDDATTFTETTSVHKEIEDLRDIDAHKRDEVEDIKNKKEKKKKKKKKKKERRGEEPPEPSLTGKLDSIPVEGTPNLEDRDRDQSKVDINFDKQNETKTKEEREPLEIIRLDQESFSEQQLPYRAPRRVASPGPEMDIYQNEKMSSRRDNEASNRGLLNLPGSRSQGRASNDDETGLKGTLTRPRSRSRGPSAMLSGDETDLQVGISRSQSRSRGPSAMLSGDETDLPVGLSTSLSRSRGRPAVNSVLVQSDSMASERLHKANNDVFHYAPIMTEGTAGNIPRRTKSSRTADPLRYVSDTLEPQPEDESLPEVVTTQKIAIPREVKVTKKPKVTRRPLKDADEKRKRRIPVDPEEEKSVSSGRSHRSHVSTRTNMTLGSRPRSRGRPTPEDLFNNEDGLPRTGDGSRDHPIYIPKGVNASKHRRHKTKQEGDAEATGDRRRSRDAKKSEEKKKRIGDDERLRWLDEETNRPNKDNSRGRKVDRKEALDRIRAIKARLANVDP
jgi:hypothetical protein